jgi:hypothetical protein
MTPEQEKALALARARKRRAEAGGNSPAMATGLAELSGMTRNPRVVAPQDGPMPPPSAESAGLPGSQPSKPYENSIPATAAQFGVGTQSGIANTLGFPVDALTSGINGLGRVTGLWDEISDPVGGSGTFNAMFAPLNESIPAPQTATERYARRIGEDVGGAAAMAPVGLPLAASRGMVAPYIATESASALGSGTAAQTAREYVPNNPWAEIAASLIGGGVAGLGAVRAMGAGGTDAVVRRGIEEQKARAADAYDMVRADQRILPQDTVDDMALGLSGRMDAERLNPRRQPGAATVLDAILQDSSGPMRVEDIEDLRRLTTELLPATASKADQRLAGIMKDEITDYLDNLDDPVADALVDGRNATRRYKAAESIEAASTKAARRAASTGSGGNEINAMRQNLRSILDTPRKSRSFTPAEREMMDAVVRGDAGQNAMRSLSRFAPTSGGVSAMLGVGGAMASPAVALPIMAVTELAKAGGERSTRNQIAALLQSIAPDRVLKAREEGMTKLIAALLAGRTMAGAE